jgi:hypothetical protein
VILFDKAPFDRAQGRQDRSFGSAQSRVGIRGEENGGRNSFLYLLLLFSGGETLIKLPDLFSWNYAN